MKVYFGRVLPQTANEIIEELEDAMDSKPKTIRTLINRFSTKGSRFLPSR